MTDDRIIEITNFGEQVYNEGSWLKYLDKMKNEKIKASQIVIDNSQHQNFNLYKSEMKDVTMMKEASMSHKEKPQKKEEKEWWNKPLWSGIILLILSSIILWWTNRPQDDNKNNKTKSTPIVQEQTTK